MLRRPLLASALVQRLVLERWAPSPLLLPHPPTHTSGPQVLAPAGKAPPTPDLGLRPGRRQQDGGRAALRAWAPGAETQPWAPKAMRRKLPGKQVGSCSAQRGRGESWLHFAHPRPAPAADTRSVPAPAWGAGGVRASSRRCGAPRAQRSHLTPVPPAGVQAATAPASPPGGGQRGAGRGAAGCRPIPGIFWELGWARRESSGACLHNVNLPQATYRLR